MVADTAATVGDTVTATSVVSLAVLELFSGDSVPLNPWPSGHKS